MWELVTMVFILASSAVVSEYIKCEKCKTCDELKNGK